MHLFADNAEINRWLDENPLVLACILLALGLALLGYGVVELVTGRSRGRFGPVSDLKGPMAYIDGAVWALFGGFLVLFGLYKVAVGML